MPEWMKESSTSFEPNKKETFMLKNRKGILFLLNKFQVSGKRNKTILSDIHPAIQLISTFLLIVLISTTQKVLVLWLLGIYLSMLLLVEKLTILRNIVKKASILILMPLIIYLPIFFFRSIQFIIYCSFVFFSHSDQSIYGNNQHESIYSSIKNLSFSEYNTFTIRYYD